MSSDDERSAGAEPTDTAPTDTAATDTAATDADISDVTPAESDPARPPPVRRPGVGAASRARRIGGRPTARSGAEDSAATATASNDADTITDDAEKPGSTGSDTRRRPSLRKRAASASSTRDENGSAPASKRSATDRDPDAQGPIWLRWLPAAILIAGVIAMAIVLFIASDGVWRGKPSASAQRDQVLAAAKTCVAATASYSYTDLAGFEKRATDCTTGQFTTSFRASVKDVVDKLAPKTKAVSKAQIDKAGLQSVAGGQWTVVVYGRVTITNTTAPKGRIDPFSAVAIMQKKHNKWVIAKLNLIHQPAG